MEKDWPTAHRGHYVKLLYSDSLDENWDFFRFLFVFTANKTNRMVMRKIEGTLALMHRDNMYQTKDAYGAYR